MARINIFDIKIIKVINKISDVYEILFQTPSVTCDVELYALIYGNDDFTVELYESVITSNNGTSINSEVINTHRDNMDSHLMHLYHSPIVNDYGIKIWMMRTNEARKAVGFFDNYSILPKPDTKYLWKIIKNTKDSNFIDIDFWWREIYSGV